MVRTGLMDGHLETVGGARGGNIATFMSKKESEPPATLAKALDAIKKLISKEVKFFSRICPQGTDAQRT